MSKKKTWPISLLVIIVIVLLLGGAGYRLWVVSRRTVIRDYNQYKINKYLENTGFSGIIIASDDEGIIYVKVAGKTTGSMADPEAHSIRPDIKFPIFSLTKQFTGYAILQLEAEGKLDRQDLISKYFDNCKYGDSVTIDDLLKMKSGLPEFMEVLSEEERIGGVDHEELLDLILNMEADDNREFRYCNTDYFLLGCIIEEVSGMSYEDYINDYVVVPAGMTKVSFDPQNTQTTGYTNELSNLPEYNASVAFSAGEICTSAINLYYWQEFLFSDDSLLDWSKEFEGDTVYNLGLINSDNHIRHEGEGLYHRNLMGYDTESGLKFVLLSNNSKTEPYVIAGMVEKALKEEKRYDKR